MIVDPTDRFVVLSQSVYQSQTTPVAGGSGVERCGSVRITGGQTLFDLVRFDVEFLGEFRDCRCTSERLGQSRERPVEARCRS